MKREKGTSLKSATTVGGAPSMPIAAAAAAAYLCHIS